MTYKKIDENSVEKTTTSKKIISKDELLEQKKIYQDKIDEIDEILEEFE